MSDPVDMMIDQVLRDLIVLQELASHHEGVVFAGVVAVEVGEDALGDEVKHDSRDEEGTVGPAEGVDVDDSVEEDFGEDEV